MKFSDDEIEVLLDALYDGEMGRELLLQHIPDGEFRTVCEARIAKYKGMRVKIFHGRVRNYVDNTPGMFIIGSANGEKVPETS